MKLFRGLPNNSNGKSKKIRIVLIGISGGLTGMFRPKLSSKWSIIKKSTISQECSTFQEKIYLQKILWGWGKNLLKTTTSFRLHGIYPSNITNLKHIFRTNPKENQEPILLNPSLCHKAKAFSWLKSYKILQMIKEQLFSGISVVHS